MSIIPTIALGAGVDMPQLGLGVWQTTDDDTVRAIHAAVNNGYTSIDTATAYKNEAAVGKALASASLPRDELFVTTKLSMADRDAGRVAEAFEQSLLLLDSDWIDLYLMHWPSADRDLTVRTWEEIQKIHESGRTRAIGVCNFEPHHLQWLLEAGLSTPAVNQIELHPRLPQYVLREFNRYHGIMTESWSPLGGTANSGWGAYSRPNSLLSNDLLEEIAAAHDKSVAQVLIRWHLQNGLIVIPKSTNPERIRQNIDVFDFELSGEDIEKIATLQTDERVGRHPDEERPPLVATPVPA